MANDMTMHCDNQARLTIATQNDAFRQALGKRPFWNGLELEGRAVITRGVHLLDATTQNKLFVQVMNAAFNSENDPWEDHSFGAINADGVTAYWKIDLYDTAYTYGVGSLDEATDPLKTRRVLTICLASEY